jgi:hypothetical protein
MDKCIRAILIIVGLLSLILTVGLYVQFPLIKDIWPWADPVLMHCFLAAITASIAASLLWIGFSGELAAATGGAINLTVFYSGLAFSLFLLSQQSGDQRLLIGVLLGLAGAIISLGMYVWFRHYTMHDHRPMPRPVYISFGVFSGGLVLVGSAILLRLPNIFAWSLAPTSAALIGWFFLGAACYFIYGMLHPYWPYACGQLWAFLAYDLVLILPFLQRFAFVGPAQLPSLVINTLVLIYSGMLAIYYLLLAKETGLLRHRPVKHIGSSGVTSG